MALNAKNAGNGGGNKNFVAQANLEAGNYPARIVQIIDFGLQPQRPYQGKDKPPVQEIGLTYELLDEFMKDEDGNDLEDKPRWLSENMPLHNLRAENAKSTKRYLALDPKMVHDGDFTALIEAPCMVTVINNPGAEGKVYDNVGGVSAMRPRDAANAAPLVNPAKVFVLDNPDMEVFGKMPKWLQDKIKGNLNFNGSPLQKALGGQSNPIAEADDPSTGAEEDPPFDGGVKVGDNNPY